MLCVRKEVVLRTDTTARAQPSQTTRPHARSMCFVRTLGMRTAKADNEKTGSFAKNYHSTTEFCSPIG